MKLHPILKIKLKNADFITNLIVFLMLLLAGLQNISAQCPTPPGDPAVYGTDSWIGYVYSGLDTNNPPQNAFTSTVYRGYITQPEQFDMNLVNAAVSGTHVCGSYADSFSLRFRMRKNFPAGYYTFTIGGDDGERLSFDGGTTWAMSDWNYHSYQTTTATFFLNGDTYLVLENYDQGGQSQISFSYTNCGAYSTAPTAISGIANICNGSSTTLTATGATLSLGAVYQWGTGTTVGNNTIAGSGASITVNPTANTTYWVRVIDPAPCNTKTTGVTQLVSVITGATAPTAISGNTVLCLGSATTLTASGGTSVSGSAYEWGTGTVGSNIIAGETGASIVVTPTVNTTYWVRRTNPAPCTNTAATTVSVTVNTPPGDQTSYGINSWIGYVYATIGTANPPADAFTVPYKGYVTEPETFNQDWAVNGPSGATICGTYTDRFAIRFKMQKNFTPGYYTFTVGGDDGYRLSLDGGATFPVSSWNDHGYGTSTSSAYYLSGNVNLVLEYYEQGGSSQVSFNYIACTDFSTAPTAISGTTTICSNTATTLTAIGGYASANCTYQWGTGSIVGNNIIGGNTASITVNPGTNSTTYWVRRLDPAPCNLTTLGVTQLVTVVSPSTNPTAITGTNAICIGGNTTLTVTGGTHTSGAVYQWGTGALGNNIIAGETSGSITVSPTANTIYWVRRLDSTPCNTITSGPTYNVTVSPLSTAPTSISNVATICSPNGGVTLNAIGGTAASGGTTYQWGTGSVIGSNIIAGTNSSLYVNPSAVTVYWVRRYDAAPCNAYTGGVTITVYPASTAPTTISGTNLTCSGANVTLTASGGILATNGSYQWGTGAAGSNIISGETAAALTVAPIATTTYWVRRIDSTPCTTITGSASFTVTVNQRSAAPISITGPASLCYSAGGGTLTANGGAPGTNATYQWGTGAVGNNIQGSTVNTLYINPSVTTTYWVRLLDPAPCSNTTSAVTFTVNVTTTSTAPTGISGTTTVCNGGSTTLTATGGTLGIGASYQWGTGTNPGSNIIAGETGVSMTVTPTATTTYWVRRLDSTTCTTATWGPNVTVTVNSLSTAPTAISGGATSCSGAAVTLTASGGTGSVYQWGTGTTVGSNTISGNGASITINPTATTTYWVRRYDGAPCNNYTPGITTTVTISGAGDPSIFGNNQWNVYGYSTGDITLATAVYAGYYTQTTLGFDTAASWNNANSPSTAGNWIGCNVPNDNFTFVHKRRGFPCGTYTLTMQNWDDASELYVDGILKWSNPNWNSGATSVVGTFNLTATSTIEVRTRENSGAANAALTLSNITVAATAPTGISGTATICSGTSTTLTATGGVLGTNSTYEWGTGTIGSNILSGQNTASITVNPTANTSYWVRRTDNLCGGTTAGFSVSITVNPATVAGSLSTLSTTVCQNTMPSAITLTGQTGSVIKWQYASNAAFTAGVTDIAVASTTLSSTQMGAIPATRYYRAVVQYGSCDIKYTTPIVITVPAAITYTNGHWSGTPNATTAVVINSNLALNSNLTVCSCQVKNGVTMTVNSNANLIVQTNVTVESGANLIIEDKGSLVQIDDASSDIGSIKMKRKSQPMKAYDYTYWSSPVQGNTLFQLSPQTLADKYHRFDPMTNNWVTIANGAQTMEPGRGYIVRAPQGWAVNNASSGVYSAEFNGVPNNGVVSATIQKGNGNSNLIGNPYPSAIDIDLFLTNPANAGIISGTIYLWTHNTAISSSIPGNQLYNYTADDYAKYNLTGGVRSGNPAITGGVIPDGKVAAGQAFFIEANNALANGTYSAKFNNSMRVAGHNDSFYRQAAQPGPASGTDSNTKNRLWLNITNANGAYNEILVGYVPGATNGFDHLYDGKILPAGNALTFYSIAGADNFSIQGKALPFEQSDVIPLGYKTTIAGTFTISLPSVDGLFANQNVYLVDHLLNVTQDLKAADYTFASAIGTFNDRFEIRFTNTALGTDSAQFTDDSVLIVANDKQVGVRASKTIESIAVFDLLGRKIYSNDRVSALQFRTSELLSAEQVLIVKVKIDGGYQVTRKIILE